jgi:predicted amidohydrolase
MGADLVAFPEVYPQLTLSDAYAHIEPADGGTLDDVREMARDLGLYVIWPRFETSDVGPRNSAVLVDRQGEVVGRYYKMFPTIGEIEKGIVPGTECPAFPTEFGTVAMAICFDLNFIEVRDALRLQRPDVVCFCSMYRGGVEVQTWAVDLGCYMVSAIGSELGRIVDRGGRLLKLATYEALIAERVNLNQRQLHMDYNWDKMDAMLEKYGSALTFDYYTQEARYVIGYEGDDRDVDEILAEFGLEHLTDYFARARRVRREKLEASGLV